MARYCLTEHVFVCVDGEHLVILDLKEDRYWALEASSTACLASLVDGWPVRASQSSVMTDDASPHPTEGHSSQERDVLPPDTRAVIEVLQGRGVLTAAASGKQATPVRTQAATAELHLEAHPAATPGAPTSTWPAFVAASALAKLLLHTLRFELVVRRVRRRKTLRGAHAPTPDPAHVHKLVAAFMRYRVFLFSSKDECLYDSLAMLEYLARLGVYPDWVFGVQTRPFAAHCWVQQGGLVLNDSVEHVSGFTPIMVV